MCEKKVVWVTTFFFVPTHKITIVGPGQEILIRKKKYNKKFGYIEPLLYISGVIIL